MRRVAWLATNVISGGLSMRIPRVMVLGPRRRARGRHRCSRLGSVDSVPQQVDEPLDVALGGGGRRRLTADARGERPVAQRAEDRCGQRLDVALGQAPLALARLSHAVSERNVCTGGGSPLRERKIFPGVMPTACKTARPACNSSKQAAIALPCSTS